MDLFHYKAKSDGDNNAILGHQGGSDPSQNPGPAPPSGDPDGQNPPTARLGAQDSSQPGPDPITGPDLPDVNSDADHPHTDLTDSEGSPSTFRNPTLDNTSSQATLSSTSLSDDAFPRVPTQPVPPVSFDQPADTITRPHQSQQARPDTGENRRTNTFEPSVDSGGGKAKDPSPPPSFVPDGGDSNRLADSDNSVAKGAWEARHAEEQAKEAAKKDNLDTLAANDAAATAGDDSVAKGAWEGRHEEELKKAAEKEEKLATLQQQNEAITKSDNDSFAPPSDNKEDRNPSPPPSYVPDTDPTSRIALDDHSPQSSPDPITEIQPDPDGSRGGGRFQMQ